MTVRVKLWLGAMVCAVALLVVAHLLASAVELWSGAAPSGGAAASGRASTLITAGVWLLTLALFAPVAWLLARVAYHPVRGVTKTARSITATGELDRRCFYPGPRDDVGELVVTVNELLVRYDAAVGRLRRQQAANLKLSVSEGATGTLDPVDALDPADLVVVDLRRSDA